MADSNQTNAIISTMPTGKKKLTEKIVAEIKKDIFSGKVNVGDTLPPGRKLAEQFKVSRVVIREALKSLEQSGLVEIKRGAKGGAYITQKPHLPLFSSFNDLLIQGEITLDHISEMRRINECANVRSVCAKATTDDIKRLRSINEKIYKMDRTKEKAGGWVNLEFHLELAQIGGNPLSKLIIQSILMLTDSIYPPEIQHENIGNDMYNRHEALINAIEARDVTESQILMALDTEATKQLITAKRAPKKPLK